MIITSIEEKLVVIKKLQMAAGKAQSLSFVLFAKGLDSEVDSVSEKHGQLQDKISILIDQAIAQWLGEAKQVVDDVGKINAKLQLRFKKIEKAENTAKNITKFLGYLDDVIEIATDLL